MEQVPRAHAGFLDPVFLGAKNSLRLIHRVSPQLDVTALATESIRIEEEIGWEGSPIGPQASPMPVRVPCRLPLMVPCWNGGE